LPLRAGVCVQPPSASSRLTLRRGIIVQTLISTPAQITISSSQRHLPTWCVYAFRETIPALLTTHPHSLHSEQQLSRPTGRIQEVYASHHSADRTPTPGRERLHPRVRLQSHLQQAHHKEHHSEWAPYRPRRPHPSFVDRARLVVRPQDDPQVLSLARRVALDHLLGEQQ
jgi:hypothetical protein